MTDESGNITAESANLYSEIRNNASASGYYLNPDELLVQEFASGLLANEKHYGYRCCPCRLMSGKKEEDMDIICPCDYRDEDIIEYGSCY